MTAVPKSWLQSEGGCELLVGGLVGVAAPAGEVVFDRDREAGEAAVAGYFAEPGFGFEHPGGGPPKAHLAGGPVFDVAVDDAVISSSGACEANTYLVGSERQAPPSIAGTTRQAMRGGRSQ